MLEYKLNEKGNFKLKKMKTIVTILICVLSLNTFAQKLVKTYWDYYETKIQSAYYTDAYGKKNGAYKGYSEHGGILLQGSYKDNAPIGKWIENYLDGKLHFIPDYALEISKGNFIL